MVPFKEMGIKSLEEFGKLLESTIGYLEKASARDLGDFTPTGKVTNAGSNNYTIYWDWYKQITKKNLQKEPYCAGYVSVMLASAFGVETAKKLLCGDLFVYCPTGHDRFEASGKIHSTPEPYDIVFFYSDKLKRWSHVGFVSTVARDGKMFTTIEANTNAGNNYVIRNGGATARKSYRMDSGIRFAFARPDYAGYGISVTKKEADNRIDYNVGTGKTGLRVMVNSLNVRHSPGKDGYVLSKLGKYQCVFPTKKTFIDGNPWFYFPELKGWCSGLYFEGWVQEKDAGNRWWYMLEGYKYPVNQILGIDGQMYYFDANGYMLVGTIELSTDDDGHIKPESGALQDQDNK